MAAPRSLVRRALAATACRLLGHRWRVASFTLEAWVHLHGQPYAEGPAQLERTCYRFTCDTCGAWHPHNRAMVLCDTRELRAAPIQDVTVYRNRGDVHAPARFDGSCSRLTVNGHHLAGVQ